MELCAVTTVTLTWIQEAKESYQNDPESQQIIQNIKGQNSLPNFSFIDGLIRFKGRLFIGSRGNLRQQLLEAIHTDPNGGHLGVHATYERAKGVFYWKELKKAISDYVTACDICQRSKSVRTHPAGLLQPLPVPEAAWKDLTMDFIERLPKS